MMGWVFLDLCSIWVLPTMCLMICFNVYAFVPVDNYLINCGSPTDTLVGGRTFAAGNTSSRLLSARGYVLAKTNAIPVQAPLMPFSSDQLKLYQTGLIFTRTSKYIFPISQRGRHWIRLYFFPFVFKSYNMNKAYFSVYAGNHLLLVSNFTFNHKTAVFKEFSLHVTSDILILTFVTKGHSFAFLNALEVVSTPNDLISSNPARSMLKTSFPGMTTQVLETIAHVNAGGHLVHPENDSLQRTWIPHKNFFQPDSISIVEVSNVSAVRYISGGPGEDIAPVAVYGTALVMTSTEYIERSALYAKWKFDIDPGFRYLIRCHFCNIVSGIQKNLSFVVSLDSWDLSRDTDVAALTNSAFGAPYYFDVVTDFVMHERICFEVGAFGLGINRIAILNGIEIMKVNDSAGNLVKLPELGSSKSNKVIVIVVGLSLTAVLSILCALVGIFCTARKRKGKQVKVASFCFRKGDESTGGMLRLNSAHCFTFAAVKDATDNFDEARVIGVGGFGKVYKGSLSDGRTVAIKRLSPQSQQGMVEFLAEIMFLSQFRHRHLVSLIGFCNEKDEMILVYEYMENGTLKSHLYGSGLPSLEWKKRLEICVEAARGLHYLHTGSIKPIIHRDVKSSNILLGKGLVARVADFGLSKALPENDDTHVSTAVRGTFGYLDPEYFRSRRLTMKSDVYSFGVVLFEVLCARPVFDPSDSADYMENLANWAMKRQKAGQLHQIIDPHIVGKPRPESLVKFLETAEKCLANCGVDRPSMEEVLCNLEHALQLEEAPEEGEASFPENSQSEMDDSLSQASSFTDDSTATPEED